MLALLLVGGAAHAAAPRVIATTGVKIAGLGIASLDAPGAAVDGSVFFRGAITTLTLGGVAFATGEPLPAPFTGTIDEVLGGQVSGDLSAVLTSASGPDIAGAIFAIDAGTVTPLLTVAPTDPLDVRRFEMNARGDVVFLSQSSMGSELYTRARANGVAVKVAGPDKSLRKLRALVIDQTGAVAWMDRRGAVSYWDALHGMQVIGTGRYPTRRLSRSPIALHETFGLLFVTREVSGRYLPATGDFTTIAYRHDEVAGVPVRGLYGDTGFLDDGTGTVLVRSKKPSKRYICLGPVGTPAECPSGGNYVSAGTSVRATRSSALFRAGGTGIRPIVRPGDVLEDAGTLADVGEHVVAGRTVAFLGLLDDGRDVLGWWRDGRVQAVVADGEKIGARTLDVGSSLYGASESTALVEGSAFDADGETARNATSLLLVRQKGRPTVLRSPSRRRFGDFSVQVATLAGRRAVVLTDDALFATRGHRLTPLLVPGSDGRQAIQSLVDLAVAGTRVVVIGNAGGADVLYELGPGGPTPLVALPSSGYSLVGVDATDVALIESISHDGGSTYVNELELVGRSGATRTVVAVGDPSPVGSIASIDAVALGDATVVLSVRVAGDGARHALLAVDR
jgi:hypothetical protein